MSLSKVRTLVSTNWLAEQLSHLKNPRQLRVLDSSFSVDKSQDIYNQAYLDKHIPGAKFYDLHKCVESTKYIPRNLPNLDCFPEYLQSLGVWADTHVVAYDRGDTRAACRAWWNLKLHGLNNVSILDGGLKKWISGGFETTSDDPVVEKSDFQPVFQSHMLRSFEDMMRTVESTKEQIVDLREANEYTGKAKQNNPDMKFGHIPGAINIPFSTIFNEDGTFKCEQDLIRLFEAAGVDLNKPTVASCLIALRACGLTAIAEMLGKPMVPVDFGSWTEWSQRADETMCVK